MDFTTITAALTGIKTATEIAKNLKGIDTSLEKAELKLKIAELIEALADAKMSVVDSRELLEQKENEIKEIKKKYSDKSSMVYKAPYYWSENEEKRDGPYCQNCYDANEKKIRLQEISRGVWDCATCKSRVLDSTYPG